MKAAFIKQFGGPEVLKYGDLPDPVAGPGGVVIDVVAASVNGADWKMRRRLALIGLTAMSAIEDMLKLQPGERILIQGGAGGVAASPFSLPNISVPM
jgi:NADPH:quinone reductase-like Zn-dependent oxidoreductase